MLACVPLALIVLALGAPARDAVTSEEVEADVRLNLIYDGPHEIDPWDRLPMRLSVENLSTTTAHPIVRPGDGSWAGRREPTMRVEWQRFDPDRSEWVPLPGGGFMGCGVYDPEWRDEVAVLAPGESVDISLGMPAFHYGIRFSDHRRVRVRMYYKYDARSPEQGPNRGFRQPPAVDDPVMKAPHGAMGDTPAFELRSDWVEFAIHPPLTLTCRQIKPLPREGRIDPFDFFEVTMVNSTERPFTVFAPRDRSDAESVERLTVMQFQIGNRGRMYTYCATRPKDDSLPLVLQPHESVVLSALPRERTKQGLIRMELDREELRRIGDAPCPYLVLVSRTDWDYTESLMARGSVEWSDGVP